VNIVRLPQGGRTAEYYSEDPYLASRIAVSEVQGIQGQHVIATVKALRGQQRGDGAAGRELVPLRADAAGDLPPGVRGRGEGGRAGALMCAYNRINGTQACENGHVQNEIARDTWGFSGLIMSDWGANFGKRPETAPGFALNGLDLDMPGEQTGWPPTPANLAGVSDDQLRLMCTRILAALFKVGILNADGSVVAAEVTDVTKNVSTAAHKQLAEQIAAAGTVLLKNVGNVLPLDGADPNLKIAVIGGAAGADSQTALAGGSGSILSSENPISPLDGIEALKVAGTVTYARGAPGGAGSLGNLSVHSTSGAARTTASRDVRTAEERPSTTTPTARLPRPVRPGHAAQPAVASLTMASTTAVEGMPTWPTDQRLAQHRRRQLEGLLPGLPDRSGGWVVRVQPRREQHRVAAH